LIRSRIAGGRSIAIKILTIKQNSVAVPIMIINGGCVW
jgi:hypothetical protein